MAALTICSDFGAPQNKVCYCFHCFPIYLPWSGGTKCHDFSFWTLSFKTALFFSLSSFTFIKRLFSSSSLSAIRVVSPAYLRWLIFLPAILISACASSSPAFHMIYSVYEFNQQGDNIQPWYSKVSPPKYLHLDRCIPRWALISCLSLCVRSHLLESYIHGIKLCTHFTSFGLFSSELLFWDPCMLHVYQ